MVRVKFEELQTAYTTLQSSINITDTELSDTNTGAQQIINTDAMHGATKEAIDDEVGNYSKPLISGYQSIGQRILAEYSNLYHDLQAATEEYANNAVIGTGALGSLIDDVNKQQQDVSEVASAVNKIFDGISDIITLDHLNTSSVDNAVKDAVDDITKLRQALWDFDGRTLTEDIGNLLGTQNSTLSAIGKTAQHAGPYTSTRDRRIFKSDKYKKEIQANNQSVDRITQEYFQKNYPKLAEYGALLPASDLNKIDGLMTMYSFSAAGSEYNQLMNHFTESLSKNGLVQGTLALKEIAKTYHNFYGKLREEHITGRKAIVGLHKLNRGMGKIIKKARADKLVSNIQHMSRESAYIVKNIGKQMRASEKVRRVSDSFKFLSGKIKKISEIYKKFSKAIEKPSTIIKGVLKKGKDYLPDAKWVSKLGKGAKWVTKKAGWIGAVANIGVDTAFAYNDQSNSFTRGNVGHSVIHASLNTLKSAGPLEGALTGAAIGGPYGAAAGFLLGTANWGWGLADKVLGTNSKNDLYNKAEQGLGTVYDSFENSAKNYLNFLGKLAGA